MKRIIGSIVVFIGSVSVFLGLLLPFYHFEIKTLGLGGADYSILYPESKSQMGTFGMIVAALAIITFIMSLTGKKLLTIIPGILTSGMMVWYFIKENLGDRIEHIDWINKMPNMSWTTGSGYYMCLVSAIIMLLCVVTFFVMMGPDRKNADVSENDQNISDEETAE